MFLNKKIIYIWLTVTVLLVIFNICINYWWLSNSQKTVPAKLTPTRFSAEPSMVNEPTPTAYEQKLTKEAYTKNGEIWLKDLLVNNERKISKSKEVDYPLVSLSGDYVIYADMEKGSGGLPRGALYLFDLNEDKEEKIGIVNQTVSQTTWSQANDLLGFVNLPDGLDKYALTEVIIYDASIKRVVSRNTISIMEYDQNSQRTGRDWTKPYNVNLNCQHLEKKFFDFCQSYQLKLNSSRRIK